VLFKSFLNAFKNEKDAGCLWLMPIILATQKAEIRRTTIQKRVGRVAQGVGPEFKPQYHKKKKTHKKRSPRECS
jgi:hypothetical protein